MDHRNGEATLELDVKQSGWYVLRAFTEGARYPILDNQVSATTSPIYVTVAGAPLRSKDDAEFFLAWIDKMEEASKGHPGYNSPRESEKIRRRSTRRVPCFGSAVG